jgi:hypothetical protein
MVLGERLNVLRSAPAAACVPLRSRGLAGNHFRSSLSNRPPRDARASPFSAKKVVSPNSIDDLVRAHEERRRDREAKRLGGSHVDDEV